MCSRRRALEQLWDIANIACEHQKAPSWSLPVFHAAHNSISGHGDGRSLLGESTYSTALSQQPEMLENAPLPSLGRIQLWSCCPWICQTHVWTSAVSAARQFPPTVGRGALHNVDGVFSIKDVGNGIFLGSLTGSDQQFRMQLLSLCFGLHEKTTHVKF